MLGTGFEADADTLVVVEGVLMYLCEVKVRKFLNAVSEMPTPRTRMIGSWMRVEPGRKLA